MNITMVGLSGEETDEQCKDLAWQMFCNAHPVEAFDSNPEGFWKFFQKAYPKVSRERMEAGIAAAKLVPDE